MGRVIAAIREGIAQSGRSLKAVFGQPDLRRIQLALAGSYFAFWAFGVALSVYAYRVDGAAGVGLVTLIRLLPSAIAAPFAGTIGDRYDRRTVMLVADLVRAATVAAAAALVTADSPPGTVYALAAVLGIVATVHRPATAAILPSLARSPEDLTAANAVASTVESVSMFAGPALGGLLLAATSVETVFLVTTAGLLVSALLIARIPPSPPAEPEEGKTPEGILRETLVGFRTIAAEPRVRLLLGLFSAQTLVAGFLNVLIVVMALELFDSGVSGVGFLDAAVGIGGLLGALGALGLATRRLGPAFAVGLLLWGVPIALVAAVPEQWAALVLLAAVGVGNALVDVVGLTLLQRAVPDEVLARVFGVMESLIVGTIALGGALAPLLIDGLGIRGALVATGAVLPVLVLLTWRPVARIDAEAPEPAQLRLLRTVPIFAPLPLPTLERLAEHLEPVRVPAGQAVFEQGDPGDRFYIVADGEVEAIVDRQPVRREGPGEGFGEIALLRDLPRTATVRAVVDSELYALERDEFVPAVTGHAESLDQADAVVSARLRRARPSLASV